MGLTNPIHFDTPIVAVILKDYQPTVLPINAFYRRGQFIPAKIRCFIDLFAQEFKLDPWVSDYGQVQDK
ncbi:MAG: hypothetical protein QNJ63_27000 [Calothrix sp. MO_192.B10]|nr:hypothetical protein [Calothrix sp. MO_192.B10]